MSIERENNNDDDLILNIDRMLREFCHAPSDPSIYRVADYLRSTTSKAFEPMIISIGPFHHGKSHLKDTEKLKMRCLKQLLGESSVDDYVHAIRANEQATRDCYAEEIPLGSDEFVQMLLLDGIFIIVFLLQYSKVNISEEERYDSLVSGFGNVASIILQDFMLFENQIPLLVIDLLLDLLKNYNHDDEYKLSALIRPYIFIISRRRPEDLCLDMKGDHLLGIVHYVTTFSFSKILANNEHKNFAEEDILSASELKEAGIVFKKVKNDDANSWLDIKFKNKTIYFPELEMSDLTESVLNNMIAYEHYRPRREAKYITDYTFFLQCLVQSTKDAEVLRQQGIISSFLGGDARVYQLIGRLGTNTENSHKFSYVGVFHGVNRHCRQRRNRWIAVLKRNHLNNPWTAISLVAAVVLLSLGILQTVYTSLSYYRNPAAPPPNPN